MTAPMLPKTVVADRRTPTFTAEMVPAALLHWIAPPSDARFEVQFFTDGAD